jgi:hypothetical protein
MVVGRVSQDRERGFDLRERDDRDAFGRAELIATPAAPNPWSSRICMKAPPAEWPIRTGGLSSWPTTDSSLPMMAGTVSASIGEVSAFSASTSTSKPG